MNRRHERVGGADCILVSTEVSILYMHMYHTYYHDNHGVILQFMKE